MKPEKEHALSTLMTYNKKELAERVYMLERNNNYLHETIDQQAENVAEWEPVLHGKWIVWNGMDIPENHGRHKCSECGKFAIKPKYGDEILTDFCPNCGAKMDGDNNATD